MRRRSLSLGAALNRSRSQSCNSPSHVHATVSEQNDTAAARQSGPVAQGISPCCQPVCSSWAGRSWHPCRSLRNLRRDSALYAKTVEDVRAGVIPCAKAKQASHTQQKEEPQPTACYVARARPGWSAICARRQTRTTATTKSVFLDGSACVCVSFCSLRSQCASWLRGAGC